MELKFKDYFSENSEEYCKYRPTYPTRLFEYLSSISTRHSRAWDCATGNGQAALALSNYFSEVIATDASSAQIENSIKKENILYKVATVENSGIETGSIDLKSVAQALHWFKLDDFIKEINRVLHIGGIIAVWSYNLFTIQDDIDKIINEFYHITLKDYWPKERKLVENGYKDISLPFTEINVPVFKMTEEWNLSKVLGYLSTWSAVKRYGNNIGINPLQEVQKGLLKLWGDPEKLKIVNWPLSVKIWQK